MKYKCLSREESCPPQGEWSKTLESRSKKPFEWSKSHNSWSETIESWSETANDQ